MTITIFILQMLLDHNRYSGHVRWLFRLPYQMYINIIVLSDFATYLGSALAPVQAIRPRDSNLRNGKRILMFLSASSLLNYDVFIYQT